MESNSLLQPECNSKDAERKQIDIEIEQQLVALIPLKIRRNKLLPISAIPPEVLCMIFLLVKRSVENNFHKSWSKSLAWIRVSHIGAHWRNVAIDFPTLWHDPPVSNSKWTAEMLQRSKNATLSIQYDFNNTYATGYPQMDGREGLKLALRQRERIGSLAVENIPESMGSELSNALLASVSRLGALHIKTSYSASFPTEMLEAAGTKIHILRLVECSIEGTPHLSQSLTVLELRHIKYTTGVMLESLVEALGNLTQLQDLTIEESLPHDSLTLSTQPSILLASLQRLVIMEKTQSKCVPLLLNAMSFPTNATVIIACLAEMPYEVYRSAIAAFKEIYITPHNEYFQSLQIIGDAYKYTHDTTFVFKFFSDPLEDPRIGGIAANLTFEFSMLNSARHGIDSMLVDLFNSGFPLEGITHVHFSYVTINSEVLTKTFGMLPALVFIQANKPASSATLIRGLKPRPGGQLYFKKVTALKIVSMHFNLYDNSNATEGLSTQDFEECLIQRSECNVGIVALTIEECGGLSHEDVDGFRRIIPNVCWDEFVDLVDDHWL